MAGRGDGAWGTPAIPGPVLGAPSLVDVSAAANDDRFADTQLSALLDAVDHVGWPFDSTERHEPEDLAALMGLQPEQAERVPVVPPRRRAQSARLGDTLATRPPELNRGGGCA